MIAIADIITMIEISTELKEKAKMWCGCSLLSEFRNIIKIPLYVYSGIVFIHVIPNYLIVII